MKLHARLHCIPLSASYAELYNIHAYFSGPSPSTLEAANLSLGWNLTTPSAHLGADDKLQRIARAGRQWKKTIGRVEDMEGAFTRFTLQRWILQECLLTWFWFWSV